MPADKAFDALKKGSGSQEIATTMAFVRLVKDLMRDKETGKRWVPIVPDEARTFGMESLFPTAGLYSPKGATYDPVDRDQLLWYKEAKDGQILNEGITEAGSLADFTAAATSYATHGEPMIPFYIFYSMFGWQRTADQFWALADQLGRGFVIGATAGRTTMTGEGLQHADGHSHLIASTNPAALSYDPAFAYEVAVIVKEGLRRMYGPDAEDVFYYLTVYNETKVQPAMPEGVEEGILKGLYRFNEGTRPEADSPQLQLLASGTAIHWALEAQRLLADDWGVAADVWSAPSWTELRRDALECDAARLEGEDRIPYVTRALAGAPGPVVAVSDWMRAVPDQIAPGSSRTGPPSAPTASACPTPARRPAATSASTRSRWSSRRSPPSPVAARSSRRRSRRPGSATACEPRAAATLRPVPRRRPRARTGRRPPSGAPPTPVWRPPSRARGLHTGTHHRPGRPRPDYGRAGLSLCLRPGPGAGSLRAWARRAGCVWLTPGAYSLGCVGWVRVACGWRRFAHACGWWVGGDARYPSPSLRPGGAPTAEGWGRVPVRPLRPPRHPPTPQRRQPKRPRTEQRSAQRRRPKGARGTARPATTHPQRQTTTRIMDPCALPA
ncbi:pyruvate dehydrogenase E1 component, homodimeric type [Streptomyces sp. 2114.4]|nr:pyruvate dehydrogenase E1 component, homodimeric type [Streptomyces sp. 2114.4]